MVNILARTSVPFHGSVTYDPCINDFLFILVGKTVINRFHIEESHTEIVNVSVYVDRSDITPFLLILERFVEFRFYRFG